MSDEPVQTPTSAGGDAAPPAVPGSSAAAPAGVAPLYSVVASFLLKTDPAVLEAFQEFLRSENGLKVTRGFKGCRNITAFADAADPYTLHLTELWTSPEEYEAYFAFRVANGLPALLEKFCRGPLARIEGFVDNTL
jgi:hypothetical protein